MARKRRSNPFSNEDVQALQALVRKTLTMPWTHWWSIRRASEESGYSCDTIRQLVKANPVLRLYRGNWVKKLGETEPEWIPFSDDPDDYLIRSIYKWGTQV